jgi:hypothetical protein
MRTAHNFSEDLLGKEIDYKGARVSQSNRDLQNEEKRDGNRSVANC